MKVILAEILIMGTILSGIVILTIREKIMEKYSS